MSLLGAASERHSMSVLLGMPPQPVGSGIDPLDPRRACRSPTSSLTTRREIQTVSTGHAAVRLLDHGRLVDTFGPREAHDPRNQMLYRQPYTSPSSGAREVVRGGPSITPTSTKAIVLDADNTLWSGIVGEDGVSGVEIGGAFPGSAFEHFQHARVYEPAGSSWLSRARTSPEPSRRCSTAGRDGAGANRHRGLASRLGSEVRQHQVIAEQFNIGLDSIVFIDDSPFEIAEVETHLPEVRCLTVPEEVEELPDMIGRSGCFVRSRRRTRTVRRTAMVQTEARRRESLRPWITKIPRIARPPRHAPPERSRDLASRHPTDQQDQSIQSDDHAARRGRSGALIASDHFTVYAGA